MGRRILELVVLGVVCSLAVLAATVGQTIAATTQAKESAPVARLRQACQAKQGQYPPIQRAKKSPIPTVMERQPEAYSETGQVGTDRGQADEVKEPSTYERS